MATRRRVIALLAGAALVGTALAGCATDDGDGTDEDTVTVHITGSLTGVQAEQLNEAFAPFTAETGIVVEYTGDAAFEDDIVSRLSGDSTPDIAILTQPSSLTDLVDAEAILPASDEVQANIEDSWSSAWTDAGSVDGKLYAAPVLADPQSYVWYSPQSFAQWGVSVPTTWAELVSVTATIREKTGTAPWCASFASDGGVAGSAGTDWIEDLVLSQSGADVYDQWASGDLSFTDASIAQAFETAATILRNPDDVNAGFGGVTSIATTDSEDVAATLADGSCALTLQGLSLSSSLADTLTADGRTPTIAADGDLYAFVLPGLESDNTSVVASGEFATALTSSEEVEKVMQYLSTPDFADALVTLGAGVSGNRSADATLAPNTLLTTAMETLQDPRTVVRLEASESLPDDVGGGTFPAGMIDWIGGAATADVLTAIQAGYGD